MTSTDDLRVLLTDRLEMRAVGLSDLRTIHAITADPRNTIHIPEGPHESVDSSRAWIERFAARWDANGLGYWTVSLRVTGAVCGVGGVDRRANFWNLYYLFDFSHWGRGYATEVARAAQKAALALDPLLPLAAWIHEQNAASQAVARHLGLKDYGLRKPEHWHGAPMHYWADREAVPDREASAAPEPA